MILIFEIVVNKKLIESSKILIIDIFEINFPPKLYTVLV